MQGLLALPSLKNEFCELGHLVVSHSIELPYPPPLISFTTDCTIQCAFLGLTDSCQGEGE